MHRLLLSATANPALGNTLVTLVSFIILMLIIRKYAWKPMMQVLIQRETDIRDSLQKAADELEESKQMNREAQETLRQARSDATQIVLQAKKQSLQIQDTMLKEAKEEVQQMREAAHRWRAEREPGLRRPLRGDGVKMCSTTPTRTSSPHPERPRPPPNPGRPLLRPPPHPPRCATGLG